MSDIFITLNQCTGDIAQVFYSQKEMRHQQNKGDVAPYNFMEIFLKAFWLQVPSFPLLRLF